MEGRPPMTPRRKSDRNRTGTSRLLVSSAAILVAAALLIVGLGWGSPVAAQSTGAGPGDSKDLVDHSPELPQPKALTVDGSVGPEKAAQMVQTAQFFYAFWNTGDAQYLDRAVASDFLDNTLP